jgi:hypothetical protein
MGYIIKARARRVNHRHEALSNSIFGEGTIGVGVGIGIGVDKTNGLSPPIPITDPDDSFAS